MRQTINKGKTSYGPNSLSENAPLQVTAAEGGFVSHNERIDARKIRARSKSFLDHFSQARLFFQSQSDPEKEHIIDALSFELGKVKTVAIRERMLGILNQVDPALAIPVALNLGLHVPKDPAQLNFSIPADVDPASLESEKGVESQVKVSPALSMAGTVKDSIKTRKIAFLTADGVDAKSLKAMKSALEGEGAVVAVIAPKLGVITAESGEEIPVDESFLTAASVLFDAVFVPGGVNSSATLEADADAVHFLNEAFRHCKAIAADTSARQVIDATYFSKKISKEQNKETALTDGVLISDNASSTFVKMIAMHRFWEREKPMKVPA
jgi:catalase